MSAVSIDEHRARIRDLVTALPVVVKPLLDCHGLRLARTISARVPVPTFDSSAMDGFALRRADLAQVPVTLPVAGEVAAGGTPITPPPAQCVRIMTGAPVPDGCDTVVPVELTDAPAGESPLPASVTVREDDQRSHIRPCGEDVAEGDTVLEAGTLLDSTHLAAAAATGHGTLPVAPRPVVLVVTTGDELVPAGRDLGQAQIPDSNSVLVATTVRELGADVMAICHAGDDPAELDQVMEHCHDAPDLVVTTGGVSVGSHDVLQSWAASSPLAHLQMGHVAMTPGKPQGWGQVTIAGRRVPLVALPGNPVAVHVGLQLFVRAAVDALRGEPDSRRWLTCPAGTDFGTRAGRTRLLDVELRDGVALPAPGGHGSHRIGTLHRADGLAVVTEPVKAGDELRVLLTR
ncbi:gephyrin-like molybdotransferase Glp [Luteococcus sp. OSA5]|uniref:molybdopterin molybdotransferase MoeA n=1 Tax=Luteococcus sp. OSA5 TaxID=3401630 RepID=UPI003B43B978